MKTPGPLRLHEEITLLAIRDEKGTFATNFVEHAVAGAVLAELLLEGRIDVEDTRRKLVKLRSHRPTGAPIIDECFASMKAAKRRASLNTWVGRLAGTKGLRHKVARQLCRRGILRYDEDKILLLFRRKLYPEVDPKPEREIVERLRNAIFGGSREVDPRTAILVSLAGSSELLNEPFGRREIKARKKRIEQIVNGEVIGKATKEVIAACQAAIMVAAILPVVATAGS
jgi:hypothetical protein